MQKGFTVLELLVVIAIIGILSSIILVSYNGYTDKAKIAKTLQWAGSINHSLGDRAVGAWTFDNITGATVYDDSGNNNNGTISGATVVDGVVGKALSFDGTNDYVNLTGISLNNGGNLTIAFWANFLAYDGSDYFFDIEIGRLLLALNANNFQFYDNAWKNYGAGIACAPYLNSWHHYVFTFDITPNPDVAKLYIDGKLMGSNSAYSAKNISGTITLMSRYSRDQAFVKGIMDDVRIFSAALTQAQIQQHYANGLKIHQNLATLTTR